MTCEEEIREDMRRRMGLRTIAALIWNPDGSVIIISAFGKISFGPDETGRFMQLFADQSILKHPTFNPKSQSHRR